MADPGIKKVRIPKNQLPPVGDDNEHLIRYRVVSDDKNRASHWSPIFIVPAQDTEEVSGELIYTGGILIAVWGDELNRPSYDIFVKFDNKTKQKRIKNYTIWKSNNWNKNIT